VDALRCRAALKACGDREALARGLECVDFGHLVAPWRLVSSGDWLSCEHVFAYRSAAVSIRSDCMADMRLGNAWGVRGAAIRAALCTLAAYREYGLHGALWGS
jgi:hypothetical protein